MTQDFDIVRASYASSRPARVWAGLRRVTESAWRTSTFAAALYRATRQWSAASAATLIRSVAAAIAVAAALQPVLMQVMPISVRPALPAFAFVVIAMLFAAAAWRSETVAVAWPTSWLGRRWPRR